MLDKKILNLKVSLNDLVELTDKNFRTVKKRVEGLESTPGKHGASLYALKPALEAIFKKEEIEQIKDLSEIRLLRQQSEAKLAAAKAEKITLEVEQKKGILITQQGAQEDWDQLLSSFQSKLLSLPSKCALQVAGMKDPNQIESILQGVVDEALNELSQAS